VAKFINAKTDAEIMFTRGTTEGINLVAQSWRPKNLKADGKSARLTKRNEVQGESGGLHVAIGQADQKNEIQHGANAESQDGEKKTSPPHPGRNRGRIPPSRRKRPRPFYPRMICAPFSDCPRNP
jgi:hypothetical protein